MHPIEESILFLLEQVNQRAVHPHDQTTAVRLIAAIHCYLAEEAEAEATLADVSASDAHEPSDMAVGSDNEMGQG